MKGMKAISLLFLLCAAYALFAGYATASEDQFAPSQSDYRTDMKKGWYWYEVEKKTENEKEKPAEELQKPAEFPDPWDMPVEKFSKFIDGIRNTAIQNPTVENVKKYVELQDIARKKAVAFANVYALVMQMHPEFSTVSSNPIANPGMDALSSIKNEEVESVIYNARADFALVYFFRQDCRFCIVQDRILKYFIDKYAWEIKSVDILEEPEPAQRFNVATVPYLLAVYRETGKYMPVVVGVVSLKELEQNLYRAVRYLKGEVKPSQYTIYDYALGSAADPETNLRK